MKLNFPFKNFALNTLWSFTEHEFIHQFFYDVKFKNDENYKRFVEKDIENFWDTLPDFENEILQIINTTNQGTIDYYFSQLKANVEDLKQFVNRQNIVELINNYNADTYKSFLEKVERDSTTYFAREERTKYKHLEEYETYDFGFSLLLGTSPGTAKKIKRKNYNFYCIEEIPALADEKYFDEYIDLFNSLSFNFLHIAIKHIESYNTGKLKADVQKFFNKSIVYVEGEHDIKLISKAAEHLSMQHILDKIEIRQRNGIPLCRIYNPALKKR